MAGEDWGMGLDQGEGIKAQGVDVQDLLAEVGVGAAGVVGRRRGYECNFGVLWGLFGDGDLGGEAVGGKVKEASGGLERLGRRREVGFGKGSTEGICGAEV